MSPTSQSRADLVTFTEEILNGKLHLMCSEAFPFQLSIFEILLNLEDKVILILL